MPLLAKRRVGRIGSRDRRRSVKSLIARDGCSCSYCQKPLIFRFMEPDSIPVEPVRYGNLDHRIPEARGGSNRLENLLLACERCNNEKGGLTEEEFRRAKDDRQEG